MVDNKDVVEAIHDMDINNQDVLGGIYDTLKKILSELERIERNTRA